MRYYTYVRQARAAAKPGDKIGYARGHGYFVRKAVKPKPKPPAPPVHDVAHALYVVFCAQEPQTAMAAPAHYAMAVSADHAYRYPTDDRPDLDLHQIVADAKHAGHRVPGWCDCRPAPDGTPAAVGAAFVQEYGLDYFIGQCETAEQFDDAMTVGATVVVGDITHLRQDQVDLVVAGKVLLIQEDYWNEGWQRAVHPAIAAYAAGVYPTAVWPDPGPTIISYKQVGRWREGDGVYHAAAVQDWASLT